MTGLTRRSLLAGSAGLAAGGVLPPPAASAAEDGYELWLRYRRVEDPALLAAYRAMITHLVVGGGEAVRAELTRGLSGMLGRAVPERPEPPGAGAVIVGTPQTSRLVAAYVDAGELRGLGPEGYLIQRRRGWIFVASMGDRGLVYGAFHLLRLLQTGESLARLDIRERPAYALRLANHWDNLDRTVERGFAGLSIFHWDELPNVRGRYADYARALASVGLNGTVVNNVNANARFLSSAMIHGLAGLAAVLREWGISLYLSANFASPMALSGLPTADPLDADVQAWWRAKAAEVYAAIPDFGGFLVKANSEGQPGPGDYGRTHADGANLIAAAVRPYGGIVMWRAFVHNFDPRTWASEAYRTFQPLDGKFADNVVLQIKNGPIDFQVREPVHPLFGALPHTKTMLELQVTQEYTGQSTHLCYLVPEWKQVYDFDTRGAGTVARIVGGAAGVMNIGDDRDWTGHQLAAANTHGYGRLAWNPALEPAGIAAEWARMTFGPCAQTVVSMLLESWPAFEAYTSPLGCGFLQNGGNHFDPDPVVSHGSHLADARGVGFDRTAATGTGDTGLWFPPVAAMYESLAGCPDELLLFFHHVAYTHRLRSGKTVIQHIYDSHFDGLLAAERLRRQWRTVRTDPSRFAAILDRFDHQVAHATIWRDTITEYFFEWSRILDVRRSWIQTRFAEPAVAVLAGTSNDVAVTVGNASADRVDAAVRLVAPAGWTSGTATASLDSTEFTAIPVPLTVPAATPGFATVGATAEASLDVITGARAANDAVVTPAGPQCVLALDAGTTGSPVLSTYQKLSPADLWDASRGFGWVGGKPQSRDRVILDALRRDFVNDTTARTLRLGLPAGGFDAYALVGDTNSLYPTRIRSGGTLLAASDAMPGNAFTWLRFRLGGGQVDLELSGDPGQHWHLNALVIIAGT
ncbi:alpha-glucuronidase family glycosyl hydrolase [Fodinicola acaciae]|uniref:alpha-glucuronidase family glycosyl hydrolase n=1 Tax=Fodinicola acaciae TaxID=2681555 RepID=UPI0013D307B8|nr:alpha-glucuronidase family glycosyl hydrolase [Fodinicola acaciae]